MYEVADIAMIVVRTDENTINAFHNSCVHRGRKLVTESGCNNSFRCPYHAWTWNLDGSIKFVPCKKDFDYADDSQFQLPEGSVGVWQGFVFVNPAPLAQPLTDFLEVLPEHYKAYEVVKIHVSNPFHSIYPALPESLAASRKEFMR